MRYLITMSGVVGGLLLVGYGLNEVRLQPPVIPVEEVIVDSIDVGEIVLVTPASANITIQNNSNWPIRFIGGPSGCQAGGCLETLGECPCTIPAHSSREIPIEIRVYEPGPFQLSAPVFLDIANASVQRTIHISGVGTVPTP